MYENGNSLENFLNIFKYVIAYKDMQTAFAFYVIITSTVIGICLYFLLRKKEISPLVFTLGAFVFLYYFLSFGKILNYSYSKALEPIDKTKMVKEFDLIYKSIKNPNTYPNEKNYRIPLYTKKEKMEIIYILKEISKDNIIKKYEHQLLQDKLKKYNQFHFNKQVDKEFEENRQKFILLSKK